MSSLLGLVTRRGAQNLMSAPFLGERIASPDRDISGIAILAPFVFLALR